MTNMDYVKLTKLAAVQNPVCEPGNPATYNYGSIDNDSKSLPIDYVLEGYLVQSPTVGKKVVIDRKIRNDVKCPGILITSDVIEVKENEFKTYNSVYKIEHLPEPQLV